MSWRKRHREIKNDRKPNWKKTNNNNNNNKRGKSLMGEQRRQDLIPRRTPLGRMGVALGL